MFACHGGLARNRVPVSVAPPTFGGTDRVVAISSFAGTTELQMAAGARQRNGVRGHRHRGAQGVRNVISIPLCNQARLRPVLMEIAFPHHPPMPVLTPIERSFRDRTAQTQSAGMTVICGSCVVHVKFAF